MKKPPQEANATLVRALAEALGDATPELLGARWWYQDLARHGDRLLRSRRLLGASSVGAGLSLVTAGCIPALADQDPDPAPAPPAPALEVQMSEGWSVGQESRPLAFPGESDVDAAGSSEWRQTLGDLAIDLAPSQARLSPFYVPTLFQALSAPAALTLRTTVRPIITPAMEIAFARGAGLTALLAAPDAPDDVAVIIDLPGPEAVAAAAALAERFEPVFVFDNWPHPAGVVPSHLTLGAALYYRPRFEHARAFRADTAAPVFVLDGDRLNHYTDEQFEFDNRYVAKLPGPEALERLGIHRILYVVATDVPGEERDDLNEDFVALERAGIAVRMLTLNEFRPGDEVVGDPDDLAYDPGPHYYWDGSVRFHLRFWECFGWNRGPRVHGPVGPTPPRLANWRAYHPRQRPTMFGATRGLGLVRPASGTHVFGQAPWSGPPGRSGSFGRWRGSFVS
jgi:hypothetical protein